MTGVPLTASDVVVRALARAGGTASRDAVLRVVATHRGRREAFLGVSMAVLGGRVEELLLSDGVTGLRLVERGEEAS